MIGSTILYFDTLSSTSDYAKEHFESLASGTVVRAGRQTAGRGQWRRVWLTPEGESLYFTMVLKPEVNLLSTRNSIDRLISFSAEAICEVICQEYGLDVQIKEPNDIYFEGRKLSGILVEALSSGLSVRGYLVGIGLNGNVKIFPPELEKTATSLEIICGKKIDVDVFFKKLIFQCNLTYQLMWK